MQREFYLCNHSKYRYLFETGVSNITQDQIDGFSKQIYNKETEARALDILDEKGLAKTYLDIYTYITG